MGCCSVSSTDSIAYSNALPKATSAGRACCFGRAQWCWCCWWLAARPDSSSAAALPSSFLPDEDQGYLYINMQLPNAASLERTSAAARQVEKILANTPGVQYTTSVVGFSLLSFVRTSYNGFLLGQL